jgi:hypothetical protein
VIPDFRDVLAELLKSGARFLVVGAHYRVDILTSISGVEFDTAWSRRVEHDIEGVRVPVIGRDEFIQNKRATGRKKDSADLESLGVD